MIGETMHKSLKALESDDVLRICMLRESSTSLRRHLLTTEDVRLFTEAWERGDVQEKDVIEFLKHHFEKIESGFRLSTEHALYALCVGLEKCEGSFPTRVLEKFSDLKIREIPFGWRLAETCLENKHM